METTGAKPSATNNDGYEHELNFWTEFVKTERFLEGWAKPIKTPELNQMVHDFIKSKQGKVLDVGSGVVSLLYGTANDLTAMDPLGEFYEMIFDYAAHGITPCLPIGAEDIPPAMNNSFDIVHCSNALDHTADAFTAYDKLLSVVKPGGYLVIQGFENEGVFENYSGLHQWNISITKARTLRIEHRDGNAKEYQSNDQQGVALRLKLASGKDWFIWIVRK